jgi:hypothetical protein
MQIVAHKKSSSTKFIFVHLLQIVQKLRSRWLEATNRVSFSGKKGFEKYIFHPDPEIFRQSGTACALINASGYVASV